MYFVRLLALAEGMPGASCMWCSCLYLRKDEEKTVEEASKPGSIETQESLLPAARGCMCILLIPEA